MSTVPVPLTPLLGRKRELDEAAQLLSQTRLLTLTGAGGSGKTRLAIEIARREARDVVWLDLGAIQEESLVPQQVLRGLDLHEPPARDVMPAVLEALRDREVILVFDNCEHLIDRVASVVAEILGTCASVTVMTTTREALGIMGETTWLVPPLDPADAIQLFAERAKAVLPIFAIEPHNEADVARICARLDGIPLAIELAAARAKVVSIREIAERLNDAFSLLSAGSRTLPRHRTLRATIDWSWRLITAQEQEVLRRLAVFAGTFSIDAVRAIAQPQGDALELTSSLVDKSLVVCDRSAGKARYRLLETVRQFAAEKLDEAGERDDTREGHARYYLALAEEAEPRLFAGANDPAALRLIDDEIANLRAIFDSDHATAEIQMRLVYALHWYWFARGQFHEARERTTRALAATGDVTTEVRAKGKVAAGHAAVWQGDIRAVDVEIEPLRGDRRALASALMLAATAGKMPFDEAVSVAREDGGVGLALTLYWSGLAAQMRGDFRAAREAYAEAHAIGIAHNSTPATAHPLTVLAWLDLYEGHRDEAMASFRRALDLHAAVDDRWGLTQVVEGIAFLSGDRAVSAKLLAASEAAWMQLGARPGRAGDFDRWRERILKSALSDEELRRAIASGAGMAYDEMIALARSAVHAGAATPAADNPLRVRGFGVVEIARNGITVDAGRAREVLLYLLCNPKGATKEQIGAALWPDAEPQRVRNNFHVTLHRLRKAVGDCISVVNDVYRVTGDVDFDVARFIADPESNTHLYRGDFFENGSGEWIWQMRDRLRDQYASALASIGRIRLTDGDFAGAAESYQRLLQLDELDEQAARQLITSYGRLGDADSAARVYRRLEIALKRELGTTPDPATVKVYERVGRTPSQ